MKKIYTQQEHKIPVEHIDKDALNVIAKLQEAGFIAYLVGGSVRDLILGITPKDFDVSTSAKPEEVRNLFRNCYLVGRRFRLAHVRFHNKIIEVSTFRAGDNDREDLIVRDNEYGTPEEDVLRRDFTINGLFYDPSNQTLIDYVNGYEDTIQKRLVTIGNSYVRFKQDPVRMIRLVKFQARFDFAVDQEAHLALLDCRQEILKSATARVLEELLRMLESGASYPFFSKMADLGLLTHLIPTFSAYCEIAKENESYEFLKEIDRSTKEGEIFDRHVLLSALVFPVFERHINLLYRSKGEAIHLGLIYNEALFIMEEYFSPYLILPKKMFAIIAFILTSQFRLVPLKPKPGKLKVPKTAEFILAIEFLKLRGQFNPVLQHRAQDWHKAWLQQKQDLR